MASLPAAGPACSSAPVSASCARQDAEAVSAFFLIAYGGFAVPVLLAGTATLAFPLEQVVCVFCCVVAALAAVTALILLRRARRPSASVA